MSRKVTQIAPKTIINQFLKGTRKTVWAAGFKLNKYAGDEIQYISTQYFTPQEVKLKIDSISKWGSEFGADRISIETKEGKVYTRWQSTELGIKFFRTQELAEQYFLLASNNLFEQTKDVLYIREKLYKQISQTNPHFINEL